MQAGVERIDKNDSSSAIRRDISFPVSGTISLAGLVRLAKRAHDIFRKRAFETLYHGRNQRLDLFPEDNLAYSMPGITLIQRQLVTNQPRAGVPVATD